jgi:hypothetical protein
MLDFKSAPKHKSGRGPSNEHFWQVLFNSVQWFQRRRFKCEKLTHGRRTLTHDKSSHGLWPGELKSSIAKQFYDKCPLRYDTLLGRILSFLKLKAHLSLYRSTDYSYAVYVQWSLDFKKYYYIHFYIDVQLSTIKVGLGVMVVNATFNNISVLLWRSV